MSSTMHRVARSLVALLAPLALTAPAAAGQVTFHGGSRTYSDLDASFVFGADLLLGPESWPVQIDIGAFVSDTEGDVFLDVRTREVSLGAARSWPIAGGPFALSAGAGASWIEAEADRVFFGATSDDDIGGYVRGGGTWSRNRLVVGADLRLGTGAEADLGFEQVDLGYRQLAVSAGWRW